MYESLVHNTFVHMCTHNKIYKPDFLLAAMNLVMTRTNAAISRMLRVTEMMITGRKVPLSSPGVWDSTYTCMGEFIIKSTVTFTLINIPSIVDWTVVVDCKVILCSEKITVLRQIHAIIHSLNQYAIAFGDQTFSSEKVEFVTY